MKANPQDTQPQQDAPIDLQAIDPTWHFGKHPNSHCHEHMKLMSGCVSCMANASFDAVPIPSSPAAASKDELREQIAEACRGGYHGIAETRVVNALLAISVAHTDRAVAAADRRWVEGMRDDLMFLGIAIKWIRQNVSESPAPDRFDALLERIAQLNGDTQNAKE